MPSLRRTISFPAVRSTPYRALSSSANGGTVQRSTSHGYRRSSGSDVSSRRVLADIEWWRVVDGQRDFEADHELEHRNHDENLDFIPGRILAIEEPTGGSDMVRTEPPARYPFDLSGGSLLEFSAAPPTDSFASLSITPHSPIQRSHSRESSISSFDSCFEPFEALRPQVLPEDMNIPGSFFPDFPVLNQQSDAESANTPLFALCSYPFSDFVAFQVNADDISHCGDVVFPIPAAAFFCE